MTKRMRTIRDRQHDRAGWYGELRNYRIPEARKSVTANRAARALYGWK